MIIAHLGIRGSTKSSGLLIRKHPHSFTSDISALHYRPWQFYNALIMAKEYGVLGISFLFGSDYPFTTPEAADGWAA